MRGVVGASEAPEVGQGGSKPAVAGKLQVYVRQSFTPCIQTTGDGWALRI